MTLGETGWLSAVGNSGNMHHRALAPSHTGLQSQRMATEPPVKAVPNTGASQGGQPTGRGLAWQEGHLEGWGLSLPMGSPLRTAGWPAPQPWTKPDHLETRGLILVSLGDTRPTGPRPPLGTGPNNTRVKDRVMDTHRGQSSKHLLGKIRNKTIILTQEITDRMSSRRGRGDPGEEISRRRREGKKLSETRAVEEKLTQGNPRKGDRAVRALEAEHGETLSKGSADSPPAEGEGEGKPAPTHSGGKREISNLR